LVSVSDIVVRATTTDGDSLSVREALALGKAVVASNVTGRPPGVSLYKVGQIGDFVRALTDARAVPPRAESFGAEVLRLYARMIGTAEYATG
jgi:hypothetical protein